MFLHRLSPEQQRAFIGIAKNFVAVDAIVEVVEAQALHRMETEAGVVDADVEPLPATAENLAIFDTAEARAVVLLELIGLAYGDDDVHPRENAVIREVASAFGVTNERLIQMEGWVIRYQALMNEAGRFFGEG